MRVLEELHRLGGGQFVFLFLRLRAGRRLLAALLGGRERNRDREQEGDRDDGPFLHRTSKEPHLIIRSNGPQPLQLTQIESQGYSSFCLSASSLNFSRNFPRIRPSSPCSSESRFSTRLSRSDRSSPSVGCFERYFSVFFRICSWIFFIRLSWTMSGTRGGFPPPWPPFPPPFPCFFLILNAS